MTILSCHISNYASCISHTMHGRHHILRRANILTHSLMWHNVHNFIHISYFVCIPHLTVNKWNVWWVLTIYANSVNNWKMLVILQQSKDIRQFHWREVCHKLTTFSDNKKCYSNYFTFLKLACYFILENISENKKCYS